MDHIWLFLIFLWNSSLRFTEASSLGLQNYDNIWNKKSGELSRKKCLEYYPPRLGIAGGTKSLPKEFPHMAAIGFGDKDDIQWQCGGSLISRKFVLTAAHCLHSREGLPKYVRLGDLDLATEDDDASPQDFEVIRAVSHPDYKAPSKYHDIALLELNQKVNFTDYISPACLDTGLELHEANLTATGWGKTGFSEVSSTFLLKVDLDHVPHPRCVQSFGKQSVKDLPDGIVEEFQICAGRVKGKDTCQGDSGGPLQIKNDERSFVVNVHNLVGITSFGKACALSGAPGIYTRVSNYIPWIESIVWENETQKAADTLEIPLSLFDLI